MPLNCCESSERLHAWGISDGMRRDSRDWGSATSAISYILCTDLEKDFCISLPLLWMKAGVGSHAWFQKAEVMGYYI